MNTQFQRLFTELFGGGTAELQLIENDDPLEAGLEIFAKPPGKKPATLSLLSGGEQALTALALIFAVFLTNPAPICVLDEVDAPLDDHNVERFCDLLDEMGRSTDTRFVIITHNPITMARMNRLYGVTMAERGISQLVSVDLEAAVKIRAIYGGLAHRRPQPARRRLIDRRNRRSAIRRNSGSVTAVVSQPITACMALWITIFQIFLAKPRNHRPDQAALGLRDRVNRRAAAPLTPRTAVRRIDPRRKAWGLFLLVPRTYVILAADKAAARYLARHASPAPLGASSCPRPAGSFSE